MPRFCENNLISKAILGIPCDVGPERQGDICPGNVNGGGIVNFNILVAYIEVNLAANSPDRPDLTVYQIPLAAIVRGICDTIPSSLVKRICGDKTCRNRKLWRSSIQISFDVCLGEGTPIDSDFVNLPVERLT